MGDMKLMIDESCESFDHLKKVIESMMQDNFYYVDRIGDLQKELDDMILENRKMSTENMKLKFELTKLKNS